MTDADQNDLILDGTLRPRANGMAGAEAFIPSPCIQNHAANLMPLPNGDMACVWFGGTQEGMGDISVYFSRLPAGVANWSPAVKLSHDDGRSEQNPILFPAPDGALWLLHTSQKSGNQDTSIVKRRMSRDNGVTWGATETLIDTPGTFVRQPLVVLPNGDWLLGCFDCTSRPGQKWVGDEDTSLVRISSDQGASWRVVTVPGSLGCVHMNIVPTSNGGLLALYRSRWADFIYASCSTDSGRSWSAPLPTSLPNNNSSIQATRLADGRIALVFNNTSAANAKERRLSLYDEIEDDEPASDVAASNAPPPARTAYWGTPRAPLSLVLSDDDGATWGPITDLETGDGYCMTNNSRDGLNRELSYPSIAQGPDGMLHVAFTYHRRAIRHIRMAV